MGEGPLSSLVRNTHTRSGMSPEVGGFNDEVVVVALQVAVLPAENVQHLHHQLDRGSSPDQVGSQVCPSFLNGKFVVDVIHPAVISHKKALLPCCWLFRSNACMLF